MRARKAGSSSTARIAPASEAGSSAGTIMPFSPLRMVARGPSDSQAMNGVAVDQASNITVPKGS